MGYDPGFLDGIPVQVPQPGDPAVTDDLVLVEGSVEINYVHFSIALSRSRRLARWVAWNIDGLRFEFADRITRDGVDFRPDPRVDSDLQTLGHVYTNNNLDRGHLARRSDLLWGPLAEARAANEDSFYFTNIAPQLAGFNQSGAGGLWGRLEDALLEFATLDGARVSVQAGPVLAPDDLMYRGTLVPREYWKLLAYVAQGQLRVRTFLLVQDTDAIEGILFDDFAVYQVDLEYLSQRTGLSFDPALVTAENADADATSVAPSARVRLHAVSDVQW